jgi:cell division protein ZapA
METVEITIGGRRFRLQCGPGEAARVAKLGRYVDQCASSLVQGRQGLGEEKLLLLTSLMLADQLDETRGQIEQLKAELERKDAAVRERAAWAVATAARRLDALAAHVEKHAAGNGGGGAA